ncbi:MAG: glycosyltransferase family 2 protein [Pseudomonadota bacterium]
MAQSAPPRAPKTDGRSVLPFPARAAANRSAKPWDLVDELTARGALDGQTALTARRAAQRIGIEADEVLAHRRAVSTAELTEARAAVTGLKAIDLEAHPPDKALIHALGPARALQLCVLPWRRAGRATIIVAPSRGAFEAARADLETAFGAPRLALAGRAEIIASIRRDHDKALITRAEARVAPVDSSRTLHIKHWPDVSLIALAVLFFGLCAAPQAIFASLLAWALLTLLATLAVKAMAAFATLRAGRRDTDPPFQGMGLETLPKITILVALYRETDIAAHLIACLRRLNYPRERLEVLLVTESDDITTQDTLARTDLPHWIRQISVPIGHVKTKPRALNFALDQCAGEIVGVYDAEDAPEPDQLLRVAAHFKAADAEVACLQGRLDFYNPRKNWLARCFTLEYAAWFRVVLPGLAKLRLPVPLGGTTLFFRAAALHALGGWDAHNVTEDADLGLRLTRRGYRTELIDTVTYEEANCRLWPWVRQRSRWIKGYAITYAVHMRRPRALLRDLGLWGFLGMQVLFLGTLSQFLLAPLLISFWAAALGFDHGLVGLMGRDAAVSMTGLFISAELLNLAVLVLGLTRTSHRGLWVWAPTLMAYFPLGTIAAYKALYELFGRPFYWDKTSHGISKDAKAENA